MGKWLTSVPGFIRSGVFGMVIGVLVVIAGFGGRLWFQHDAPQIEGGTTTYAVVPKLPGFTTTFTGAGMLLVPRQLAPGDYTVGAPSKELPCRWARLKAAPSTPSGVLGSRNIRPGDGDSITVGTADGALWLRGYCVLKKDG